MECEKRDDLKIHSLGENEPAAGDDADGVIMPSMISRLP
jgi:hypothetical protein